MQGLDNPYMEHLGALLRKLMVRSGQRRICTKRAACKQVRVNNDSAWPTWKKNHESMNHDLDNLGWHHQACVTTRMCNWRVTVVVRLVTMALPWFETRLPTTMSRGLDLGAAWIGKTAPMIQWLVLSSQSSHNHGRLWTCKSDLGVRNLRHQSSWNITFQRHVPWILEERYGLVVATPV